MRKMRICIDLRLWDASGVGTYLQNTIPAVTNYFSHHEFFLLGHVANSIGYSPEKVAEVIQKKGISSSKSSGWFSWLFG